MLALAECCVEDRGGTYAFCDTDSLAVVASPDGGEVTDRIRALSWADVEDVRDRFRALNPYAGAAGTGSVLEKKEENFEDSDRRESQHPLYCHGISAKRYVLFNRTRENEYRIRKYSEHGLGYLLNPRDPDERTTAWIEELWQRILRESEVWEAYAPNWFERPAVSRLTISSPHYLTPFDGWNEGKPYAEQIKPMNFLLSAHVQRLSVPAAHEATKFHLIAPFEKDPAEWMDMGWIDRYSGQVFPVTTEEHTLAGEVAVKPYEHVYEEYLAHPETKNLGPEGELCRAETRGLLQRRPVEVIWVEVIGKESNELEGCAGRAHPRSRRGAGAVRPSLSRLLR